MALTDPTNQPVLDLKVDLSIGHPSFMQEYWSLQQTFLGPSVENFSNRSFRYSSEIHPPLEKSIRLIHKKVGNADVSGHSLAIGSGATEALIACLVVLKNRGYTTVFAEAPHFTRFQDCARLAGLHWSLRPSSQEGLIEIVTAPNNPDGKMQKGIYEDSLKILDLSYHWPQYTQVYPRSDEIMIFSLSKATGHAGTRLGWLFSPDQSLTKSMNDYLFLMHYGVSFDAQRAGHQVLEATLSADHFTCFDFAKEVLNRRFRLLKEVLKNHPNFELASEPGMFALLKARDNKQDAALEFQKWGILALGGRAMNIDSCYVRLNLGCLEHEFQILAQTLQHGGEK